MTYLRRFVSSLVVDNDCVFRDVVDIQVLHRRRGICLWIPSLRSSRRLSTEGIRRS